MNVAHGIIHVHFLNFFLVAIILRCEMEGEKRIDSRAIWDTHLVKVWSQSS